MKENVRQMQQLGQQGEALLRAAVGPEGPVACASPGRAESSAVVAAGQEGGDLDARMEQCLAKLRRALADVAA